MDGDYGKNRASYGLVLASLDDKTSGRSCTAQPIDHPPIAKQSQVNMLFRRLPVTRPRAACLRMPRSTVMMQLRHLSQADIDDPNMNGGYINPPPIKRQFRDPYGDWWDKQERRNFGEPVHEDNDILGIFSPEEYTHTTPGKALFQIGCFVTAVLGLCGIVYITYPDKPSAPREYEGGLEAELGGPTAVRARAPGDE